MYLGNKIVWIIWKITQVLLQKYVRAFALSIRENHKSFLFGKSWKFPWTSSWVRIDQHASTWRWHCKSRNAAVNINFHQHSLQFTFFFMAPELQYKNPFITLRYIGAATRDATCCVSYLYSLWVMEGLVG